MGNHRAERRGPRRTPSETRQDPRSTAASTTEKYVGRRIAGREQTAAPSAPAVAATEVVTPVGPDAPAYPAAYVREDEATVFHDFEITEALPLVRLEPGRRRAVRPARARGSLVRGLPSAPVLVGLAALAVSAGGAVTAADPGLVGNDQPSSSVRQATALSGSSGVSRVNVLAGTDALKRTTTVSRDSRRDALADAADQELVQEAEAKAEQRNVALQQLAQQAEGQAAKIKLNLWQLPISAGDYRLTARFGQYGLWASYHTGLDFAAPTGTPIHAIANGVVTSAAYDGSYGNKTVVTLDDGTELWYCHQNAFGVSVGDVLRAGDVLGYVGSTGNVTGPHVHIEVRPGGGDPVDPYQAMLVHGLQP